MNLDYSKKDEAVALIEEGDKITTRNCTTCQGHSWPGRKEGEPGHCSSCEGTTHVTVHAWECWTLERKIDYWQARALVAEADLKYLEKEIADSEERRAYG